jgi:hypothetical protein
MPAGMPNAVSASIKGESFRLLTTFLARELNPPSAFKIFFAVLKPPTILFKEEKAFFSFPFFCLQNRGPPINITTTVGILNKTHLVMRSFPKATGWQQFTRAVGNIAKIAMPFFGVGSVGGAFDGALDLFNQVRSAGDPKLATAMNPNNPANKNSGGGWGDVGKLAGGVFGKLGEKGGVLDKLSAEGGLVDKMLDKLNPKSNNKFDLVPKDSLDNWKNTMGNRYDQWL